MSDIALVVADTTPLNYLVLIEKDWILASLFGEILIPTAVWLELQDPRTPEAVDLWARTPPPWLRIATVHQVDPSLTLGAGENEAISLALEQHVKVVLMDERKGRTAAHMRGLLPIGTLNLIDFADAEGLLDGVEALNDLRQINFRASQDLLAQFEAKMEKRRT
jgi:predicted nucleic acid-binding protein